MSEKSRLKDSDEILNSLGRSVAGTGKQGDASGGSARGRRSRRQTRPDMDAAEGPALDFGKYELQAGGASAGDSMPFSPDEPMPIPADTQTPGETDTSVPDWILSQMPADGGNSGSVGEARSQRRGRGRPPGKKQSVSTAQPVENEPPTAIPAVENPRANAVNTAYAENTAYTENTAYAANETRIEEYSFESFDDIDNTDNSANNQKNPPAPPPSPRAKDEVSKPANGDPRSRLLVDDDERDVFMKELSQRFERRFAEKFETPIDEDAGIDKKPLPDIPDFWGAPSAEKPKAAAGNAVSEEISGGGLAPEAEEFVGRFMNETLEEEENRSREFKDTLAQKFMRERERYLKELDMAAREVPEAAKAPEETPPQKPVRRKLDFQIVPEMHLRDGEAPPVNPVTYTRNAKLRPQAVADEALEDESAPAAEPETAKPAPAQIQGKKTAEQLLNELAAQTKAAEERLGIGTAAPAKRPAGKVTAIRRPAEKPSKNLDKSGLPVKGSNRTMTRQAVIFSAAAFMLLTCVVLWTFKDTIFPPSSPIVENSEAMVQSQPSGNETLTVYEDRRFTERGNYGDVLIKRSNVNVSNLSVKNLLVVSDIETRGEVSLRDVNVDGAIHVKSCAANVLSLTDVKTPRVVINNAAADMIVRISGDSDIGEIEMRSAGTVEQAGLSGDSLGVRGMVTDSGDSVGAMIVTLSGLNMPSLAASGETAFKFNDSYVGNMASSGSLSIEGTGRIVNLSAGAEGVQVSGVRAGPPNLSAAIMPMALTEIRGTPVSLIIKGVSVSNLNLRSSGELNISAPVDLMTVSDNISITGDGSIGSLTVNKNSGGSRITVDISGVNIPALTSEAETRLNILGAGIVNNLICNASTYAFGNKVNNMVVNADGCVYEKMPDRISRAEGVRPPESAAENPNLDYNAASGTPPASDAETSGAEEAVGTSCGHTRENGGFIIGDGSKSTPFEVSSPAQLAHVALHLNSFFIQTKDMDIADDSAFSGGFPVIAQEEESFSGEYDGRGYSIKNLRITADSKSTGLFGSNTGTITNVHILSGDITSTLGQGAYVGAIAGFNYSGGQVLNCSNRAKVTGKLSYVGGIVGYNYGGRIKDCYNAAKISAESDAGGIVGVNRQDGSVAGCYNAGTISAEAPAGAVAGTNDAKIINCYYLADTAEKGIGRGEGSASVKTSEELQGVDIIDELAAGNLDTPWRPGDSVEGGYNYPVLVKLA